MNACSFMNAPDPRPRAAQDDERAAKQPSRKAAILRSKRQSRLASEPIEFALSGQIKSWISTTS
jgi:hypothetical protein